jgi:hypothetical protein
MVWLGPAAFGLSTNGGAIATALSAALACQDMAALKPSSTPASFAVISFLLPARDQARATKFSATEFMQ